MKTSGENASELAGKSRRRVGPTWDAASVRSLRRHLRLTQTGMADELGTRQQTVSEWETGLYRPRGASARLLTIIAERAGLEYAAGTRQEGTDKGQDDTEKGGDAGRP